MDTQPIRELRGGEELTVTDYLYLHELNDTQEINWGGMGIHLYPNSNPVIIVGGKIDEGRAYGVKVKDDPRGDISYYFSGENTAKVK